MEQHLLAVRSHFSLLLSASGCRGTWNYPGSKPPAARRRPLHCFRYVSLISRGRSKSPNISLFQTSAPSLSSLPPSTIHSTEPPHASAPSLTLNPAQNLPLRRTAPCQLNPYQNQNHNQIQQPFSLASRDAVELHMEQVKTLEAVETARGSRDSQPCKDPKSGGPMPTSSQLGVGGAPWL